MTDASDTELYFGVNISVIGSNSRGTQYEFMANEDQRVALGSRFGCVDIQKFEVKASITPLRKEGHYGVSGVVSARVVQNCVVSLEPVVTDLEQKLDLILLPEEPEDPLDTDVSDDEFETYSGNIVDLGELGAIEMALAIDPYPRAPGVSVSQLGPGGHEKGYEVLEEGKLSGNRPFEALAAIKRKG